MMSLEMQTKQIMQGFISNVKSVSIILSDLKASGKFEAGEHYDLICVL